MAVSEAKTDAFVSNTCYISLKKVFAATKIQKQVPQVFYKRRPTILLKKLQYYETFKKQPFRKISVNGCLC